MNKNDLIQNSKRVVIKIGSALLIDKENGNLNNKWLNSLALDINNLLKGLVASETVGGMGGDDKAGPNQGRDPKEPSLEPFDSRHTPEEARARRDHSNSLKGQPFGSNGSSSSSSCSSPPTLGSSSVLPSFSPTWGIF